MGIKHKLKFKILYFKYVYDFTFIFLRYKLIKNNVLILLIFISNRIIKLIYQFKYV